MLKPEFSHSDSPVADDHLLEGDEVILLVDDYPEVINVIHEFLKGYGLKIVVAASAKEMRRVLQTTPVALLILDIGLPDADGRELIPELRAGYSSTSIMMLSAVTDLQTALACLRLGADDYLTKPVRLEPLWDTVRKILEKRRLMVNNLRYQEELEQTKFRIQLMHKLALKMNTAYLSMTDLDEIFQTILVGITANEGLRFNRAFLALFDESGKVLQGRMAIGPGCRREAGRIWQEMDTRSLSFQDMIDSIKDHCFQQDSAVNRIAKALRVEVSDTEHILIRAAMDKRTINVRDGQGECGQAPVELMGLLEEDTFVIVPLYSPGHSLGVIIADHFVTGEETDDNLIEALESFAGQASLAIEHCNLYRSMKRKIKELEDVSHELEENKDLLVESERYSAIGHMAAELVHNIRNPITAIGGTARLLTKKIDDPGHLKFLNMMTRESAKIEHTLEELFCFVEPTSLEKKPELVSPLIRKSLLLYYNKMKKQAVDYHLILPENEPACNLDAHQMRRVFIHLIRNAVEAMPDGGDLTIEVSSLEERLQVAIRERGAGSEEENGRQGVDSDLTIRSFGTGIGLAMVQQIVQEHKGELKLLQLEKGGCEAIVLLPL